MAPLFVLSLPKASTFLLGMILTVILQGYCVTSFSPISSPNQLAPRAIQTPTGAASTFHGHHAVVTNIHRGTRSYPTSIVCSAKYGDYDDSQDIDGTGRGQYILAFSLLVCIWCFSIPVELRRAHWCFSDRCEQNRSLPVCNNCVTFGEWSNDVAEYYRNGGGVHFDFSVGEETKELFSMK
ncbi:expressed unknown protein [Seminavis robusta]|uniref:Uncharacterized protein n=1 Tax=Seminavis robusta TaxID=568900 RepID=A0A9N8EPG0_9STRA|nr:expressed unknown protein [Seminavis robusta]|eukprot:Sro1533_g280350.1 n/a (181) ;mRNA; r:13195-13826